ncbi:MAG TPA: XdhC family protein [Syntrophobacteraceae bacterium]|nr:XdhC family protein [Syntrophobacteraceae bacterium]
MEILDRINQLLSHDESFCLATVLESPSAHPCSGRKLIVRADGSIEFTTGMEDIDRLVAQAALAGFKRRRKLTAEVYPGFLVFFDFPGREVQLVICGAGHIAVPLARYARDAGFSVTVIDDREEYANRERFADCEVIAEEFVPALRRISYGPMTYVAVITRGHEHDALCLGEVLKHDAGYIGLIGSRRRVRFVLEMLESQGIAREKLSNVFTPIGIPIGGESPEEIALSIAAELVCVRSEGPQQAMMLRNSIGGLRDG